MEIAYLQRRRGKGHIRCVKLPAVQRFLCSRVIDGVVDALHRALHMDVFAVICQIQLFRFNFRLRFLLCPPFLTEQAVEAFQKPMRAVVDADLVCQLDEILQLLPQLCVLTGKQPVRHRLRRGTVRAVGNVQTPAQERRVVGGEGQRVGAGGRDGDKLVFRVLGKLDAALLANLREMLFHVGDDAVCGLADGIQTGAELRQLGVF